MLSDTHATLTPTAATAATAEVALRRVREDIARLSAAHGRRPESVRLVAVSKRHGADKVVQLARLGQRDMAENYVQEGVEKQAMVARALGDELAAALCWHFIGHIQSRKCHTIAEHFHWVHTLDRPKVAAKLNQYRSANRPLNVLIQLNLQGEASKSGVAEAQLPALAEEVVALPGLRLRGLMILPEATRSEEKQRAVFRRCRELRDELNARGFGLDHLSMGMSGDMAAAIAEGTNMVRIGTALFGPRPEA